MRRFRVAEYAGTTQKMLTQQLRELEEEDIIARKVYPQVPPTVEYSITESLPLIYEKSRLGLASGRLCKTVLFAFHLLQLNRVAVSGIVVNVEVTFGSDRVARVGIPFVQDDTRARFQNVAFSACGADHANLNLIFASGFELVIRDDPDHFMPRLPCLELDLVFLDDKQVTFVSSHPGRITGSVGAQGKAVPTSVERSELRLEPKQLAAELLSFVAEYAFPVDPDISFMELDRIGIRPAFFVFQRFIQRLSRVFGPGHNGYGCFSLHLFIFVRYGRNDC